MVNADDEEQIVSWVEESSQLIQPSKKKNKKKKRKNKNKDKDDQTLIIAEIVDKQSIEAHLQDEILNSENKVKDNKKQSKKKSKKNKGKKKSQVAKDDEDDIDAILKEYMTLDEIKEANVQEELKEDPLTSGQKFMKQQIETHKLEAKFEFKAQDNSVFRLLGSWKEDDQWKQSTPPTVPIDEIYSEDGYPEGQICEYTSYNSFRTTSVEKK